MFVPRLRRAFDESNTTFVVSGTIDKYGWVEFMETSLRSMVVNILIVKDQALDGEIHVTAGRLSDGDLEQNFTRQDSDQIHMF